MLWWFPYTGLFVLVGWVLDLDVLEVACLDFVLGSVDYSGIVLLM